MVLIEKNDLSQCLESKNNFQNLKSVIQYGLRIDDLQIVNYTTSELVPPGQNFGSTITKLDVTIRKNKKADEETLQLVAKLPITGERPIVNWSDVFTKEVFMYVELIPMYKSLEREMGVKNVLDPLPKYMGHRCSLDEINGKVDENSLLLMENLEVSDYYIGDRHVGLDLKHAEKALGTLASFHALGIVLKDKRPDDFKRAVIKAQTLGVDFEQLDEGISGILPFFQKDTCFSKHLAKIEASFDHYKGGRTFKLAPIEPWATIIHGDSWVNNIMFHKDMNGCIDDVKFIDFQCYLYSSPLKDLHNLISSNIQDKYLNNHANELLNLYHEKFVTTLKRMSCNIQPFSRDSFDKELKRQALNEFPFAALAIKFSVYVTGKEQSNNEQILATVFDSSCNDDYKKRLLKLIDFYEKMGWF